MVKPSDKPSDRTNFFDTLSYHISCSEASSEYLAVLVIRLPGLRAINTEFGFAAGDKVLSEVGTRIKEFLRPIDYLCLITGAEYALILPSLQSTGQAILAAQKIAKLSQKKFSFEGKHVKTRVAVGIAFFPDHAKDNKTLLRFAEQAVMEAEGLHENYEIYSAAHNDSGETILSLEGELESAISNSEIQLHYQPQIELKNGKFTGVEALARWNSSSRGPIRPDIFIKVAEQTGLILPLTLLTVNVALRECAQLQQSSSDSFSVAINLSASILHQTDVPDLILRALSIWGIQPSQLTLEVTETAVMSDPESCRNTLEALSAEDINISIDDFGTGQSSLRYLNALPIKELKIDKSFVMNINQNDDDVKIVRSIIDLAHNFELTVVAEGIEDIETQERLASLGCDYGQGFFIARPMPLEDLEHWTSANSTT